MFLEYQCAAMTPVEIRGVKVVTRDAPKIYKNCQHRSTARTKKFQDKFPLNTRRYCIASSFRCGTIFTDTVNGDNGRTFSAVSCAATFRIRD